MSNGILGKLMVFVACVPLLGLPGEARAQESIWIAGVSLKLGMAKNEVLRKLSETGRPTRKIWDDDPCELWMVFPLTAQGGGLEQLQFCQDQLCYASVNRTPEKSMDLHAAAPFAHSMIDALAHLEAEQRACTIQTGASNDAALFYRYAKITCGDLHVGLSVIEGNGFKFGGVDETLGQRVFPSRKRQTEWPTR